jgi:FKBP-type peptidyl-prolyl cis-trans isomerase
MLHLAALLFALAPAAEDPPIPADKEVVTTPSGLAYSILRPGTGDVRPGPDDLVVAHYNLWLEDGKLFDSSHTRGTPFRTRVNRVIKGWQEGLTLMTEGAVFKLTIPHELGYGEQGQGGIPPKAKLVFEVELLDVIQLPKFRAGDAAKQVKTDSGLVYEELRAGQGEKPGAGATFKLAYAIWTPEGELVRCSEEVGDHWMFKHDDVPWLFLSEALPLFTPGARYRFEVPATLLAQPGADVQHGGQDMVVELELVASALPLAVPAFALPETTQKTESGLEYEVIRAGTGEQAVLGKEVTVHYAGWLEDGTLFDSSYPRGFPAEFGLVEGRLIKGWTEGVPLMSEGAIYRFKVPPELGYGERGNRPKIGPNATLVFQVELIAVE